MASSTGHKGGRKIGRGMRSPSHSRYVALNRCLTNKLKKLVKHTKKFKNDKIAKAALYKLGNE